LRLKQEIRVLTLVPSSGGVFEVTANGKIVHSKKQTGQFPEPEAVLKAIRVLR